MGYRVEEWTSANDKSEAARVMAVRVQEETLSLSSPSEVPVGEWVAFDVKLATGDSFLEGMGRCEHCAGDEGVFMVRLGMLQFDVMNEVMFERIQLENESLQTGEHTGEIDISDLDKQAKAQPKEAPKVEAPM